MTTEAAAAAAAGNVVRIGAQEELEVVAQTDSSRSMSTIISQATISSIMPGRNRERGAMTKPITQTLENLNMRAGFPERNRKSLLQSQAKCLRPTIKNRHLQLRSLARPGKRRTVQLITVSNIIS
jgi:hypothetical protein